jgi:hypothetical protein
MNDLMAFEDLTALVCRLLLLPVRSAFSAAVLGNLTLAQEYLDDCQNLYTCQVVLDRGDEG